MANISATVMAGIEWDDALSMPIANEENKQLEKLLQQKQTSAVAIQNDLAEMEDRVHGLDEHLKNMQQELQYTQGLVSARERDLQTENNLLKLTQREKSRLQQEVTRLMKEMDDMKNKRNAFESRILKQNQKLQEMKSEMNWDQRALDAWFEESAKSDEDSMTLQKYTRQDEVKIKELSLCMEKLIADTWQKKHQLNVEVISTLTCQIELDKIAEHFRNTHLEREELLSQWENTIELMQKRDREMDMIGSKIADAKKEIRSRNNIIQSKLQHLQRELESNKQNEKKISVAERTSIQVRKQLADAGQQATLFENETDSLRRTLERMVIDLDLTRLSVTQVNKEIVEKTNKLEHAKKLRDSLNERLKIAVTFTLNVGEQATKIDDLLMLEEKRQEELLGKLKLLESLCSKKEMELHTAKSEEKIMEATINCSHNTCKNLASKLRRLDSESLQQQEVLYSQNLILQQLEKRCFHMQGEQTSDEKLILENKITELQSELDYKNQTHTTLIVQLRKLQDCRRMVERILNKFQNEKADLLIKIHECNLCNISFERELKGLIRKKQNLLVEQSLMKLELKKIQDFLNSRADNIFSMEMRKLQMETAMKERHQEIKIHKEMLTAKIKVTEEKKQQLTSELYDKMSKMERIKMRYQFMMVPMTSPDGDEEKSQVYFVIKATQETEALQREGDDLDTKIRKAEKEILALENTLNLLKGKNVLFQQSFKTITETSNEMTMKHDLDEQMKAVMDKYKYKKRQIQELHDELYTEDTKMNKLTKDVNALEGVIQNKKNKIYQLKKEIQDQRDKLQRAAKHKANLIRNLKASRAVLEELPEERDINIRELRDFNQNIMMVINNTAQMYPEMIQAVRLYFTEADLPLSGPGWTRQNSLISSRQSSVSNAGTVATNFDGSSESSVYPTSSLSVPKDVVSTHSQNH